MRTVGRLDTLIVSREDLAQIVTYDEESGTVVHHVCAVPMTILGLVQYEALKVICPICSFRTQLTFENLKEMGFSPKREL